MRERQAGHRRRPARAVAGRAALVLSVRAVLRARRRADPGLLRRAEPEPRQPRGIDRVVERRIGAAQQRLPERPAREQVGVLLPGDAVAAGQGVELLVDAGRLAVRAQLGRVGVGEIAQAVALGVQRDVAQPDRVVAAAEVVVREQRLGQPPQPLELRGQHRSVGVRAVLGPRREEVVELAALVDALVGPGLRARVQQRHLAQHRAQARARQRVVGDERDAVRREAAGEQRHQRVARVILHPGVHAVRHDVVELPPVAGVEQVGLLQAHARQAELGGGLAAQRRVDEVEADRRQAGRVAGHRDQVEPVGAAGLEHARRGRGRGLQPVQGREQREPVGMRLREREAGVGDPRVGLGVRHAAGH